MKYSFIWKAMEQTAHLFSLSYAFNAMCLHSFRWNCQILAVPSLDPVANLQYDHEK